MAEHPQATRPPRKTPVIRASEIGRYIYCNRAWWYDRLGIDPANVRVLARGAAYHRGHGRKVRLANALRTLAILLLLGALLLAALYVLRL